MKNSPFTFSPYSFFMSFFVSLALLMLINGCGGGTSSTASGSGFDAGHAKSNLLSQISQKEASVLCENARGFIRQTFSAENLCSLVSVLYTYNGGLDDSEIIDSEVIYSEPLDSERPQICAELKSECEKSDEIQGIIDDFNNETKDKCGSEGKFAQNARSCSASFETYSACIEEQFATLNEVFDSASCDNPQSFPPETTLDNFKISKEPTDGPACKKLFSICPQLLDEESEK